MAGVRRDVVVRLDQGASLVVDEYNCCVSVGHTCSEWRAYVATLWLAWISERPLLWMDITVVLVLDAPVLSDGRTSRRCGSPGSGSVPCYGWI